ncbi:MAG: 1-acyl-sn-glycerol-3-phosphate acyltransferase [Clostridia bacterium]|nr:1-acyl-sn-glycerol-3-phosphate acyltransferase [Clostridia bacterium]
MIVYKIAKAIFLFYFHCFNRIIIKGKENEVMEGPVIVFGNHYSNLDVFLMTIALKRQIRFMGKHTLFRTPVVGPLARAFGAFPVDRTKADLTAMKTALRILKNGEVLGIFPEGTRIKGGKISDPKGGIAMFAFKTKSPVLPIHVEYRRRFHFLNHIEMTIGKPIPASELGIEKGTPEEYKVASERLIEHVYSL